MAEVLKSVDSRTQLAGHNRMELLMFRLQSPRRFGINVFKVREVIPSPVLTRIPKSASVVLGIARLRGHTISVIDLNQALGGDPMPNPEQGFLIISEYNRAIQGFLVNSVERIINKAWDEIKPPPGFLNNSYLTAVTNIGRELVQVIDVEKIISEVTGIAIELTEEVLEESGITQSGGDSHVLVVDDSAVARKQITRTLDQIKIEHTTARDGSEALDILSEWAEQQPAKLKSLNMIISDIEMPKMDGYTLTKEIRNNPQFQDLYVLLHSSLSGVFNQNMVKKVGANDFLAKFSAEELVKIVAGHVQRGGPPTSEAA